MEITVHAKRAEPSYSLLCFYENFSGFQITRAHNASILPKCLDESLGSSLQRYCKARENTNLFAVFRAAAYLHLAEQDKCSESSHTLQQIPNKKETPLSDVPISIKEVYVNSHPNTMSTRYSGCDIQNLQLFRLTYHSSENDAGVLDMTVYTYA